MSTFSQNLKDYGNTTLTENGAVAKKSTGSAVYDMFATGGAYRSRSYEDIIEQFSKAYAEDSTLALKCLFYLRDIRGGQGERRYFRVAYRWLISHDKNKACANIKNISEFGRWDDLIKICVNTSIKDEMYKTIVTQLLDDYKTDYPSLLAKWLPSINTSSAETRKLAKRIAKNLGATNEEYRKMLSGLRKKIDILERKMSDNEWDKIEFDKIPSKAGLQYRNAFKKHEPERYEEFINSKTTKVNVGTLYPYNIVHKALLWERFQGDTERKAIDKYWESLPNYFEDNNKTNMICVVDTSGSMCYTYCKPQPIEVAISLGIYCAQHLRGAFANHFITFSSEPQLVEIDGTDFVEQAKRIKSHSINDNTNLEAVFDLLLDIALLPTTKKEDIPTDIVVISDMQIDTATSRDICWTEDSSVTEMEKIKAKWARYGIKCPRIVYWNVLARGDANIIDRGENVSFVSGCSPIIMKQVLTGKTGYDLMLETLNSDRYSCIC